MLTVSGTWEQFARQRTEQFREECARLEAGMQRAGTVTLEEHRAVDPDGPVFAEVRDVCEQCLRDPHGTLKATMQGMPRFFQDLAPRASAKGWLHLWVLRLAGRAIAAEYQLGADGSLYALRTDCDSSLGELTPDACLRLRIIQSLFEERHAHQYYVAHDSSALDWATGLREAVGLHIYAPSSYGRLLHGIETQLVPFARRWRFASAARCA
jgi:CelD/BcsL family acetyltransferase involved in cellulose biosynthesis